MSTSLPSKISWILVADRVVDALDAELGGECRLHAVDHRQLGVSLPLGLEALGVLQRQAEAARDGRDQLDGGLVERPLLLLADHEHADRRALDQERHVDERVVDRLAAQLDPLDADLLRERVELARVRAHQRRARLHGVAGEGRRHRAAQGRRAEALAVVEIRTDA